MTQRIQLTSFIEQPEIAAGAAQNLLVMASLRAPDIAKFQGHVQARAPVSVSAVIDRSSSMKVPSLSGWGCCPPSREFIPGTVGPGAPPTPPPSMDSERASGCTWSTARATARLRDSRPPE